MSVKHIIASLMVIIPFIHWVTILMHELTQAIGAKEVVKFVSGLAALVALVLIERWLLIS